MRALKKAFQKLASQVVTRQALDRREVQHTLGNPEAAHNKAGQRTLSGLPTLPLGVGKGKHGLIEHWAAAGIDMTTHLIVYAAPSRPNCRGVMTAGSCGVKNLMIR